MRLDAANRLLKRSVTAMLAVSIGVIIAITLYFVVCVILFAMNHKLIELQIFLDGKSDLMPDINYTVLYTFMLSQLAVIAFAVLTRVFERCWLPVTMFVAMLLAAAYCIVALITEQKSPELHTAILAYTVISACIQLMMFHATAEKSELKKENGYDYGFSTVLEDKVGVDIASDQWNKMTADEKLMAEREGNYRGR